MAAEVLEQELERRALCRAPPTGVEYIQVTGVQGLREAGVLKGVRAMAARIFGGEGWYVRDEGGTGRVECLYEGKRRGRREVKFIVARLVDGERWATSRGAVPAGAGVRAEEAIGPEAGGEGALEPSPRHTGQEAERRCLVRPLSNTPMGVNQRAGGAGGGGGARAAAVRAATGRAAGERDGREGEGGHHLCPLVNTPMGVNQRTGGAGEGGERTAATGAATRRAAGGRASVAAEWGAAAADAAEVEEQDSALRAASDAASPGSGGGRRAGRKRGCVGGEGEEGGKRRRGGRQDGREGDGGRKRKRGEDVT